MPCLNHELPRHCLWVWTLCTIDCQMVDPASLASWSLGHCLSEQHCHAVQSLIPYVTNAWFERQVQLMGTDLTLQLAARVVGRVVSGFFSFPVGCSLCPPQMLISSRKSPKVRKRGSYARQPKEHSSTSPNQGLRKFGLELRAEFL